MKKKSLIALLLAASLSFGVATATGCNIIESGNGGGTQIGGGGGSGGGQTGSEVTGVVISSKTLTLKKNATANLSAVVYPLNAADISVSWKSSNSNIVSVDQNGKVTAKNVAGTATITVTTNSGNKQDSCTVTVEDDQASSTVAVTGVTVSPTSLSLKTGGSGSLTATVAPEDATNTKVNWSSSNSSVASVDQNGLVTAGSVTGTAKITATTEDGNFKAVCNVTVSSSDSTTVKVTSITINPSSCSIQVGDERTLATQIAPSGATNKSVEWSSANSSIATVDQTGKVHGVKKGTVNITATAKDGSGTKGVCAVTVTEAVQPVTKYTVNFYSDGNKVASQEVEEGENVSSPADVKKEGYYIVGWGTASATGANYDFSSPVTGNLDLHAKWQKVAEGLSYSYAGNECAAFEWGESNLAGATVRYKLSGDSSYQTADSQLIRAASAAGKARVDVVGLKGGANYDFEITSSAGKKLTITNMQILSYDRSGYAHFNYTSGVGAYNDDGTLKSGARVLYVTEENKNNVDGNNNSIAQYLQSSTNIKNNKTPLVIRLIGKVKCPQYLSANNLDTSITDINGIIRKPMTGDSYWNMIDIAEGANITLEGIGEDATVFQFGFTWKKCKSIEVRNLTFTDYPEDACSFEGSTSSPSSYKNFWLHHSVFNIGKNGWDRTDEQDKGDGDGASDVKGVSYVTFSYLQYNNCHKTGLVGGDDKHLTSHVTFHHNYYNQNEQRLPLGRQANMHMYNNYYKQGDKTLYSISLRAGAYALIENNYFDNTKGDSTIETRKGKETTGYGYGKLWNNKFANESKKGFKVVNGDEGETYEKYIKIVSSRTEVVTNTNSFNQSFDTDSDEFYYDSVNKKTAVKVAMLEPEEVPTEVPKLAGVMKRTGTAGSGGSGESGGETGGGETGGESGGENEKDSLSATFDFDTVPATDSEILSIKDSSQNSLVSVVFLVSGTQKNNGVVDFGSGSQSGVANVQMSNTGALRFVLAEGYTYSVTIYAGSSSNDASRTITLDNLTKETGVGANCIALNWTLSNGTYSSSESGKIRIARIIVTATPI